MAVYDRVEHSEAHGTRERRILRVSRVFMGEKERRRKRDLYATW